MQPEMHPRQDVSSTACWCYHCRECCISEMQKLTYPLGTVGGHFVCENVISDPWIRRPVHPYSAAITFLPICSADSMALCSETCISDKMFDLVANVHTIKKHTKKTCTASYQFTLQNQFLMSVLSTNTC